MSSRFFAFFVGAVVLDISQGGGRRLGLRIIERHQFLGIWGQFYIWQRSDRSNALRPSNVP